MLNLVSIIVPIYNVEKYLVRCINSIIQQSYSNIEVLLINDGSEDNCESICQKFINADKRIRYYKKKNGGLSSARNYGIERANGEYLVFIDSDDYIAKDMIQLLVESAVSNNADIVECDFLEFEETEGIVNIDVDKNFKISSYSSNDAIKSLICNTGITPIAWSKIYKKHIFSKLRYKEKIYHEDEEIIIKLLNEADKICKINIPLYFYMKRRGSIINSPLKLNHFDIIEIMQERIQLLRCKGFPNELIDITNARLSNIYNELYARILLSADNKFDEKLEYIKNKKNKQIKKVLLSSIKLNKKMRCLVFYLMPKISYKIVVKGR